MKPIEATVLSVKGEGSKAYAIAQINGDIPTASELEPHSVVTFSLAVWESEQKPRANQLVRLTEIVKFSKGWRANKAEPIRA